jgi:hypothetical protein
MIGMLRDLLLTFLDADLGGRLRERGNGGDCGECE